MGRSILGAGFKQRSKSRRRKPQSEVDDRQVEQADVGQDSQVPLDTQEPVSAAEEVSWL